MEYKNDINLTFQIEFFNETGEKLGFLEMNPLDVDTKMMCVETSLNSKTNYSCTGRIHNFTVPESYDFIQFEDSGKYSFKVILFSNSYDEIEMKEAALIIKK